MKVCYTALFGHYEELKEPKIVSSGWEYICFTDQDLTSDVWQIRKVKIPEGIDKQRLARYYKIMEWVDWPQSMWVDASFIIETDLNKWWDKYFKNGLSAPKHPTRNCIYEEIDSAIMAKRGDTYELLKQKEEYTKVAVPRAGGIITSGLLMRENRQEVINLCQYWWLEMQGRSVRDQVAFARVSPAFKDFIHTYDFDYTLNINFRYIKHFKHR